MDSWLVLLVLALIVAVICGGAPPSREPFVITVAPPDEPAANGGLVGLALLGLLICLLAFGGLN
jgi:hypothetical protein